MLGSSLLPVSHVAPRLTLQERPVAVAAVGSCLCLGTCSCASTCSGDLLRGPRSGIVFVAGSTAAGMCSEGGSAAGSCFWGDFVVVLGEPSPTLPLGRSGPLVPSTPPALRSPLHFQQSPSVAGSCGCCCQLPGPPLPIPSPLECCDARFCLHREHAHSIWDFMERQQRFFLPVQGMTTLVAYFVILVSGCGGPRGWCSTGICHTSGIRISGCAGARGWCSTGHACGCFHSSGCCHSPMYCCGCCCSCCCWCCCCCMYHACCCIKNWWRFHRLSSSCCLYATSSCGGLGIGVMPVGRWRSCGGAGLRLVALQQSLWGAGSLLPHCLRQRCWQEYPRLRGRLLH